ncbi:MAG: glutamate-1-semialdehyde 2,1-aminomutase [Acidobacteriota bacterium]
MTDHGRPASARAFERARAVSPGGVHSPVRAFRAVDGPPVFFDRGEGAEVVDLDGRRLLDTCLSWGPLPLGHAHPAVVEAVREAAGKGLSFGACHAGEAALCELILEGFPHHERVRLVSSGTEAVMTALRLARGVTGRSLVVKYDGGYHGHLDSLLVSAGSGLATLGVASSAGVPAALAETTLVAPFDDLDATARLFAEHGSDIACVALEPLPGNNGLLPQRREFLAGLRELCDEHGALLLFDEVISGFRLRFGGYDAMVDLRPDLTTLGKIVGGGLPIGAVAGRAELMDRLAPEGDVYQAGTLSGNPVSVAAGTTTLRVLRDEGAHDRLEELGRRFESALSGGPSWMQLQRQGSLNWLYLSEGELPRRADAIAEEAITRFTQLHPRMLAEGVYLPPSGYELFFLSTAHSEEQVDRLAETLLAQVTALD